MFSKDQVSRFRKALSVAEASRAKVEQLAKIAAHSPQYREAVEQLRTRVDMLATLSQTALEVSAESGQS